MSTDSLNTWIVAILIIAAIASIAIATERLANQNAREAQMEDVFRATGGLRARIEGAIGQQLYAIRALAAHIAVHPDITQGEFSQYVSKVLPKNSVISVVAGAPGLTVQLIYPLDGNRNALGLDYRASDEQRQAVLRAIENRDVMIAGPVNLVKGGKGLVARAPVFELREHTTLEEPLWGVVAAVIESPRFYSEVGLVNSQFNNLEVALRGRDGTGASGPIFYGKAALFEQSSESVKVPIQVAGGQWQLAALPNGGWVGADPRTRWMIRLSGVSLGLLMLLGLYRRQQLMRQTNLAQRNFKDLFDLSSDALFINDAETLDFLDANQQAQHYLGYSRDELGKMNAADLYREKDRPALLQVKQILESRGQILVENEHLTKSGEIVPVEISSRRVKRENGDILISAARDISGRKANEAALKKSQQDLVSAIESINEGFTLWDEAGSLCLFNQRYLDLFPELKGVVKIGAHFSQILTHIYDGGMISTDWDREQWIKKHLHDHHHPGDAHELRLVDGRYLKISEYLTPDRYCVGIYEDITELKRATEHVHYRAYFDVLTGLPNRENFLGKLTETLSAIKRTSQIAGLLFIDLDRFKSTNDALGHNIGDKLLREVALRLRSSVRQTDFVARFAGDEFVVLLRYIDNALNAASIADTIVNKLSTPFSIDGHEVYCGASIGIAISPEDTDEPETLLKYADLAMYQAKAVGGNAYRFFTSTLTERAQRFAEIEKDLRRAIEAEQFELHYQPVFNLTTNSLESVEALIRWRHPTHGMMMPDEFISIAEETGIIDELGRWVIKNAAIETMNWCSPKTTEGLRVAINVSSRQFWGGFNTAVVQDVLTTTNFPADRLIIEITESLVVGSDTKIIRVLEALRNLGVGISIDDFGTGYSALSYLRRLPVTMLKIDRSFVTDIEHSKQDAILVESIVAMAKALRVLVVAEGVETAAQKMILSEIGCDFGQGLLYGAPVDAARFRARYLGSNIVNISDHAT